MLSFVKGTKELEATRYSLEAVPLISDTGAQNISCCNIYVIDKMSDTDNIFDSDWDFVISFKAAKTMIDF